MQGLTSLETLELSFLLVPDLRCIWKGLVPCNLTTLKVKKCERLTHVFTNSMIASLIQLKVLEISACEELELQILIVRESSQLLGVFGQDDHASPVNVEKEMVLPRLKQLILEKLPSIVYFSHGCYDFIFPRLWILDVRQCPKLTTRFATTSNGLELVLQVSQVAEGSSTGCSVPTSTAIWWTRDVWE